jgi:hypothetical protein
VRRLAVGGCEELEGVHFARALVALMTPGKLSLYHFLQHPIPPAFHPPSPTSPSLWSSA